MQINSDELKMVKSIQPVIRRTSLNNKEQAALLYNEVYRTLSSPFVEFDQKDLISIRVKITQYLLLKPEDPKGWNLLSYCYNLLHMWPESIDAATSGLEIVQSDIKQKYGLLVNRATAKFHLSFGTMLNSIEDYSEALKTWIKDPLVLMARSRAYFWNGEFDLAQKDLDNALRFADINLLITIKKDMANLVNIREKMKAEKIPTKLMKELLKDAYERTIMKSQKKRTVQFSTTVSVVL